jgi:transposase
MITSGFRAQDQLFIPGPLFLLDQQDRYRLFAQAIMPQILGARPALAKTYCSEDGRPAIDPALLLGLTLLQFWECVPDRQALALLRYHIGWCYAVGHELGAPLFHPTTLVHFRKRLMAHQQSAVAFETILKGLKASGLLPRRRKERLDSTQVLGLLSHMSRLECCRTTLRQALEEIAKTLAEASGPAWWPTLWERYVESRFDFRSEPKVLQEKFRQTGQDGAQVLAWNQGLDRQFSGRKVRLLTRVWEEQFELVPATPAAKPLDAPQPTAAPAASRPSLVAQPTAPNPPHANAPLPPALTALAPTLQPKAAAPAGAVQNPHEPEAQWAAKGTGRHKKEGIGYKVQVAESLDERPLAPGEPTRQFITAIATQPAITSDEAGMEKVAEEQQAMNQELPLAQYVDAAYISAEKLALAQETGRPLIGPAQPAPHIGKRFSTEDFTIDIAQRQAVCPAGQISLQCSRLEIQATGKINFRFEWSYLCADCSLRKQCCGADQKHRSLLVGQYHDFLQARRREQKTEAFRLECRKRNALEGTQSELVRAHDLRHARYRGLTKVALQNYMIGAACNAKRWIRRLQWQHQQEGCVQNSEKTV